MTHYEIQLGWLDYNILDEEGNPTFYIDKRVTFSNYDEAMDFFTISMGTLNNDGRMYTQGCQTYIEIPDPTPIVTPDRSPTA